MSWMSVWHGKETEKCDLTSVLTSYHKRCLHFLFHLLVLPFLDLRNKKKFQSKWIRFFQLELVPLSRIHVIRIKIIIERTIRSKQTTKKLTFLILNAICEPIRFLIFIVAAINNHQPHIFRIEFLITRERKKTALVLMSKHLNKFAVAYTISTHFSEMFLDSVVAAKKNKRKICSENFRSTKQKCVLCLILHEAKISEIKIMSKRNNLINVFFFSSTRCEWREEMNWNEKKQNYSLWIIRNQRLYASFCWICSSIENEKWFGTPVSSHYNNVYGNCVNVHCTLCSVHIWCEKSNLSSLCRVDYILSHFLDINIHTYTLHVVPLIFIMINPNSHNIIFQFFYLNLNV